MNLPCWEALSWMVQWHQCEPSTPRPCIADGSPYRIEPSTLEVLFADSPISQDRTLHVWCPYHGWFGYCSTHIICMRQQSSGKRAVQVPDAVMSARSRRISPWVRTRLKSTTPQRHIYYISGNPNHLWMEREMILPRGLDIFSAQLT